MEKNSPLEKTLNEILAKEDFSRLVPFKEVTSWQTLTSRERDLLGILFVAQGENELRKGDIKAIESFEVASKVAPNNPLVFYQQALAYATQEDNPSCLISACKALSYAVALSPDFFESWYTWGVLLMRLGVFHDETRYLEEAQEKFQKAQECSQGISIDRQANHLWQWGVCLFCVGKYSGEACDFHASLEKYQEAAALGFSSSYFWNDCGDATAELAILLGSNELIYEAIGYYRKTLEHDSRHFSALLNLARCFQRLFEGDHEELNFHAAQTSFELAAEVCSDEENLWLYWGQLFAEAGKHKQDVDLLKKSCEKFSHAYRCNPENAFVLSRWAEALILCGTLLEKVEYLKAAELRIAKSIALFSENPEAWYLYGTCLNELGRYFADESFYLHAIEKFQYGLKFNETHPLLWYGMALAYFALGELCRDVQMIEASVRHCAHVVELSGQLFPQFWNDWGVALMKLAEMTREQKYVELALEKFEQIIDRSHEDSVWEFDLEWLYHYGCALDFLGDFTEDASDYERAVQVLSKVVEQDPTYLNARYNLALAFSHLGEVTDDVDAFHSALFHFEIVLTENSEDELAWNDWGMALLTFSQLVYDPLQSMPCESLLEQAEQKFLHAAALGGTQAFYNLACLYSLQGNIGSAMHYLEHAEMMRALPSMDELLSDEWLDSLRGTVAFRQFIALLSNKIE